MLAKRLATCIALALLVGAPVIAKGDSRADDARVDLTYTQGGAVAGEVFGKLAAHRLLYDGRPPDQVAVEVIEARFVSLVTKENHTRADDQSITVGPADPNHQKDEEWALRPGIVQIEWTEPDQDSLLLASGTDYWEDRTVATMDVEVTARSAQWTGLAIGGHYGVNFHERGDPYLVYGTVTTWHRWVTLDDAEATITAPFMLHIRQAQVTMDGEQIWERQPYGRTETTLESPAGGVRRTTTTYTDGYLFVDEGSMRLPLGAPQVSLGDADWQVSGEARFDGATGAYHLGEYNGTFNQESIGLAGVLELHERTAGSSGAGEPESRGLHATARGEFAVIAVDHVVRASAPIGMSLVEQAMWITLLGGGAAFVFWALQHAWMFLFVRVNDDAVLDHPRRALIMRFVTENPGCHMEQVATEVGLARGVTRHHVMVLERAGFVLRRRQDGLMTLLPSGRGPSSGPPADDMNDPRPALIQAAVADGSLRRAELVAAVRDRHGIAEATARRWIDLAARRGLIRKEGSGQSVTYRAIR